MSSLSIFASAALVAGATFAFFSDEETSADNVFAAGGLDLRIDYDCYYNVEPGPAQEPNCPWDDEGVTNGSWEETDLGVQHKFFDFDDIKPGDFGEGTISLHVIDNDAWAQMRITGVEDLDVDCTEAEANSASEPDCDPDPGNGELREALMFSMWLDQGETPGFQNGEDPGEGDNIQQEPSEPTIITEGTIDAAGELHVAAPALAVIHDAFSCSDEDDDTPEDGAAGGLCPGLTNDGHFVGSITYYLGVAWHLPEETGDEVQTDSLAADIAFEVEQYRHNPSPSP